MYLSSEQHGLELPESLRAQMFEFRRRVRIIKLVEAGCGAAFGVLMAFLITFALDRLWDTPASVRLGVFAAAVLACAVVPLALHRWVWQQRQLEQLARLLTRKHPSIGDQLLGIIELVRSESEQARSITLCKAAIEQVAEQAQPRDFADAVPNPRHRRWAALAGGAFVTGALLFAIYPAASTNAWARFLMPWHDTPRYTFTMIESLPERLVVAHGEPFSVTIELAEQTVSHPSRGHVRIGAQTPVIAQLDQGAYRFELPPQIDAGWLDVRIGDFSQRVRVEPTLRPELSSIVADVALPKYLGRAQSQTKDVRGGAVSLVDGSQVAFVATATRALAATTIDGQSLDPKGARLVSPAMPVDGIRKLEIEWQDEFGLAGKEPFVLSINGREDEPPSIACDELPRQKVVLDSEQLGFNVTAQDDYGVKRVGMEWQGADTVNFKNPAHGERILVAGGPEKELVELAGTFSAMSLEIEPQPIHLRLFVEDFFPGRERVYSSTYVLYVLNAEQHSIWLTEQLSKWHRQSLDVRDRELQLYETNKQLRELTSDEINQPENRRRIESQSSAERANGRRLSNLVRSGEDLVKQAMRNPEFGVGHLEKWAEMLQILKDISANRMPSVADLLKQASKAPRFAKNSPSNRTPSAGQIRASGAGKPSESSDKQPPKKNNVPAIVDIESSQQPLKPGDDQQPPSDSKGSPRLGLPTTTLLGGGGKGNDTCPVGEKMDEAITQQQDLLAEFEKIADELNRLLANLEGSTLVKRLKAASRLHYRIAGRLGDQANEAFGVPATKGTTATKELFKELSEQEMESSHKVSNIMDDMQGYFERRRFMQFKTVLDEMREEDVIGSLRQVADEMRTKNGLSMAQCEYWSDTLDRWAEDLVEPTSGGT